MCLCVRLAPSPDRHLPAAFGHKVTLKCMTEVIAVVRKVTVALEGVRGQ